MMQLPRRSIAALASAAVMLSLMSGGFSLGAQDGGQGKSQAAKGKKAPGTDKAAPSENSGPARSSGKVSPPDPAHRLPPGYAKLGLSAEQKEAIYKVQGKYYPQIQALEKQAAALRAQREAECEAILKPAQKRMLTEQEQQKKAAAAARKSAAKAAREKS